jgi:hypothetical protein
MSTDSPESVWLKALQAGIREGRFIKLTLSRPRLEKDTESPRQIRIRPVTLKKGEFFAFLSRFDRRDETQNLSPGDAFVRIAESLNRPYRAASLFLTGEMLQLDYSKKGRPMLRRTENHSERPATSHDRAKHYLLNPNALWLNRLGVTDENGSVLPSMSRKWKQINKFAEVLQPPLNALAQTVAPVHVADFGCGKGLLTFALYEQLRLRIGPNARVTGVELREHLVREANHVAQHVQFTGLSFVKSDIREFVSSTPLNGIIALHACDTATDLAILSGIRAGAAFILCAPCCHKEIRPQISVPLVLQPVLRFGIQLGQEADMITDSLRVLLLESQGYDTKLFEFISLEHTAKNKMILAVKAPPSDRKKTEALRKIKELKAFYGIQFQSLESGLREDGRL